MADTAGRRLAGFVAGEYEALLRDLRARGYRAVPLGMLDPGARHMFLRHDVDLCMERAAALAEREAEAGFSSTYYFLLSTRLYNLASPRGREILARIRTLGHEIGLHFDTTKYEGSVDEVEEHATSECHTLSDLAGVPIDSLSFHRPAPELLGRPGRYAGRRHTYEPDFFSAIAYISDSNGGWHHGHPLDHPAVADGRAIQLLTHPVWWSASRSCSAVETIENFRREQIGDLTEDLRAVVSAYRQATETE